MFWSIFFYNFARFNDAIFKFVQYPIALGYAITIHKAQGQTYKHIAVDIGDGAFASGQLYVGLSRCTHLENMYLVNPVNEKDIVVSQEVIEFMKNASVIDLN